MILQIMYQAEGINDEREEYVGEVEAVRFFADRITFMKGKYTPDRQAQHHIEYKTEENITEVYLLNNDGKTIKRVDGIQETMYE